jgi:hypothetical protein
VFVVLVMVVIGDEDIGFGGMGGGLGLYVS